MKIMNVQYPTRNVQYPWKLSQFFLLAASMPLNNIELNSSVFLGKINFLRLLNGFVFSSLHLPVRTILSLSRVGIRAMEEYLIIKNTFVFHDIKLKFAQSSPISLAEDMSQRAA